MTGLILGVDPDKHGALALIARDTGALVELADVPLLRIKDRWEVDAPQLAVLLDGWAPRIGDVFIEKAGCRPVQGVIGAYQTGLTYGLLLGIVRAQFLRVYPVAPAVWKRAMGLSSDKDVSRQAASDLYPREAGRWALKTQHGRAEAALLAAYGRRWLARQEAA